MAWVGQRILRFLLELVLGFGRVLVVCYACLKAYRIRMYAVDTFGHIIHEFDPWFNFRATEYLAEHGLYKFFRWYDYMSWYPIGRPVGTTIYPGMQISSVAIWEAMKYLPTASWRVPKSWWTYLPKHAKKYFPNYGNFVIGPMSLNDICCVVPAWYGAIATFTIFLLTWECSGSMSAGVFAACVMAVIPAHIMRSMAGGYDNEAVAVSSFCATFWLWCRAVRSPGHWPYGALAGLMYVYAVANWGGYIFVNNLIGVHATLLVALGKYNTGLYRAYSLWYVIGTAGATFIPVVGWTPLRSMEQMGSLLVFICFQIIEFMEFVRRRSKRLQTSPWRFFFTRVLAFVFVGAAAAGVAALLVQVGYFAPWSSRIRALFLKHEKTGNPLVDSVAEHQAGNSAMYESFLHHARYLAVVGLFFCFHQRTPSKTFPLLYALVAWIFSLKMSRLMVICGPIVSMLAGYPVGIVLDWCVEQVMQVLCGRKDEPEVVELPARAGGMGSIWRKAWDLAGGAVYPGELRDVVSLKDGFATSRWTWPVDRIVRLALAVTIVYYGALTSEPYIQEFKVYCDQMAPNMANPSIVFKTQTGYLVDDYLVGYRWLRNNTPEDARVMAWWDYGYQITGIGNRTSIADGNTWNHEHIATLGRTLTNPEKRAWNIMRHLTDYVLVWAGGHGDDMGKSPHLARIGNSVFPDMCGEHDPFCNAFGFLPGGQPTKMMAESFLYKAVNHKVKDGVSLNPKLFKEVLTTKHGLMRVFKVMNISKESKAWIADPQNRVCDAPGSWYCVGQYPPALDSLISKRKNFAQLEDFNKKGASKSAYTKRIEEEQRATEKSKKKKKEL